LGRHVPDRQDAQVGAAILIADQAAVKAPDTLLAAHVAHAQLEAGQRLAAEDAPQGPVIQVQGVPLQVRHLKARSELVQVLLHLVDALEPVKAQPGGIHLQDVALQIKDDQALVQAAENCLVAAGSTPGGIALFLQRASQRQAFGVGGAQLFADGPQLPGRRDKLLDQSVHRLACQPLLQIMHIRHCRAPCACFFSLVSASRALPPTR